MFSAKELSALINRSIEALQFPAEPTRLYAPIRYILSMGGKRIRPLLTLMTANLYQDNIDHVIPAALSIELFHNFTLVHDDIMDAAPLRRNKPTVHKRWDENIALLSGDALSMLAYRLLQESPVTLLPEIYREFIDLTLRVCEGQQYDMDYESVPVISIDEYIRMIRLKTATLIAGAMKIGAIAAEAPENDILSLENAGISLGLAFQIKDDYLDVYGNKDTFGKKRGGDILNNKKTFLWVSALEKADEGTRQELIDLFSGFDMNDPSEKIKRVSEIYTLLQIPDLARKSIQDYTSEAITAIDNTSVETGRKNALLTLVHELLKRTA